MNNISIFSIDNTLDKEWNLPFIRLGRYPFSSSCIHDRLGDNINECQFPLDMANAIYWIYKNINIFGNPQYVGVCHYRRFFTHTIQHGILPIQTKFVDQSYIATPIMQQLLLHNNKADGIVLCPFYEDFLKNPNSKGYGQITDYKYAWEGSYLQLKTDNIGVTFDDVKLAYDYLLKFSTDELKPYIKQAFLEKTVHFCSIFTLKTDIFNLYCKIVLKALIATLLDYDENHLFNDCNCRVGGYLLERIGSCFFHALKLKGMRLLNMPIIETEFGKKPIYRNQTCKDAKLKFNSSLLKSKLKTL